MQNCCFSLNLSPLHVTMISVVLFIYFFRRESMNLGKKMEETLSKVATYWKTPPLGKYVSYKEAISYGIGGMGVQFVIYFSSTIALSATSFLVGNTIGIKPMDLQLMSIASTLIGFLITIARSYIIDNSRLKMGKFRPWLAIMGIPTVILSIIFVWLLQRPCRMQPQRKSRRGKKPSVRHGKLTALQNAFMKISLCAIS